MKQALSQTSSNCPPAPLRAGAWRVEPQLNRISRNGTTRRLEPRVSDLLAFLARRPGEVVSKQELLEGVWGDVFVTEGVLKKAMSELRRALGDDARKPRVIETISRRGYRLIAEPRPMAELVPVPSSGRRGAWRVLIVAGLLSGLVAVAWRSASDVKEPVVHQAVPLTALAGRELFPALSADGSRLAFAWNGGRGDDYDLYVKLAGGEHRQLLVEHPAADLWPAWSPDGNHLAFARQAADPAEAGLFVVSSLGGPPRRLLGVEHGRVAGLDWSPRGGEIVVALEQEGKAPALHGLRLGEHPFEVMDLRPLTHPPAGSLGDRDPVYSPDGDAVAFSRAAGVRDQDVFAVDAGGGEARRLTSDRSSILGLAWIDGGAAIVYSSDRRGPRTLWRVPATGGMPRWLPAAGDGALHPAADRAGERLAFEQVRCDTDVRRLGSEAAPLIASTRRDEFPQISPDGARVAFVSTRGGSYEVYTADAAGGGDLRLTSLGGPHVTTLRWSPEGSRIAFAAWHQGRGKVYLVNVGGGPARPLAGTEDAVAPGWSADGDWIYLGSRRTGRWEVWKVPATGGEPRRVTTGGGWAATESSDGRTLYYTKYRRPGIWRRPVAGGAEELVLEDFDRDNGVDWVLADGGIYYLGTVQGKAGVAFFDFAGAQASLKFDLDRLPVYAGLTVSPDGRSALVTHVNRVDGDVVWVRRAG